MEQEPHDFEISEAQTERITELPPELHEFVALVINSQNQIASELGQQNFSASASFNYMDSKEFAKRFSPMFLAVYKPSEHQIYLPNIPKKFQFQQAFALGHELTHAAHEPAVQQVTEPSLLESYNNLKEGITSYINEIVLSSVPIENQIYSQRLKEARKLKKYQNMSDQEIIVSEIGNLRHSYHHVVEALVNSVENGQQQLLEGWFSGNLSEFESSLRERFGDDFLEQLKNLNFKNRQDFINTTG